MEKDVSTNRQKHLSFIDSKLDESERMAAEESAEWISEDDFWAETGDLT